jgi:AraC family transcriptional regulator, ethanolamine operon transcriptional activator
MQFGMQVFDDFDAWGDAIRGAHLRLACDGVEVRSWRLATRLLGRAVIQTAFEGGGNLCFGGNSHAGPLIFLSVTHPHEHVANCERLSRDAVFLIPPGADFSIRVQRRAHAWCSVALPADFPLPMDARARSLGHSRVVRCGADAAGRLRQLVTTLAVDPALSGPATPAHDAACDAILRAATACLSAAAPTPQRNGRPQLDRGAIIRAAMATLEHDPATRPSVASLAAACRVTERTLARAFHDTFGVSPLAYTTLRLLHRVRRGLRVAATDSNTVSQVLTAHGVWDFGRFAARYRRQFGESPSATLQRHRS